MQKHKREMVNHQLDAIKFVSSLQALSNALWRREISEGKWTVAEIIGHFKPWDEFVLYQRLPYIFLEKDLPRAPDPQLTNATAAAISRNESQQVTIDKFILNRKGLYKVVKEIPESQLDATFLLGDKCLSLYDYLKGLAAHDRHHFNQIKRLTSGSASVGDRLKRLS
ncbi:DinB family protein [Salipaludibacillus sp. LMS25]|uniref:DinB family protein n=1 Tax=Salipaludibacillus sp. LMS25 TaxID=2924031 RepID=UPI0020D013CC|nr:DinB family protein [Salipaludibacillus sp. LMS25]UTR13355.1 DinB family protein [Salipaludibacillus sp. LMS25]